MSNSFTPTSPATAAIAAAAQTSYAAIIATESPALPAGAATAIADPYADHYSQALIDALCLAVGPYCVQQENTCTANGPSSPAPYAAAPGYPTFAVTIPAAGDYCCDVVLEYVPSNAADLASFAVTVDGTSFYPGWFNTYSFSAGQLGTVLSIRFTARLYGMTAGAHTVGISWGTAASGFLATTPACHGAYTVHR